MDAHDLFMVLVRENGQMLSAYIRAASADQADADDIWQETMLTAWRRWDDYDHARPFGAWLRGIAKNQILAVNRKRAARPVLCEEATLAYFSEIFTRVQALHGDTFDEKLSALRECLENLPETYQKTIRLRFEDGFMPAKISEVLTIDLEAVKKRLYRAKSMLSRCLFGKLDAHSAAAKGGATA